MRFDLSDVLNRVSDSLVVGELVDLTGVRYRGIKPFSAPVSMTAAARFRDGVVSLDCSYTGRLELVCDRCLAPFVQELSLRCSHIVVRELSGPDDETFLVAPDGIVELSQLATNAILPELPSRFLCSEDCKGLCPVCGRDRNTGVCSCTPGRAETPLQALKDLLNNE